MLRRTLLSGFTLIEILVSLAIMVVLLALGLPSLTTYLANAKIRASATNFSAGMQFARAESIRRNGGVGMILTSDAPTSTNASTATLSPTGPNWIVRLLNPGTPPTYTAVQAKAAADGSTQVVIDGGAVSSVNFSGLGGTDQAAMVSFDFSNPSGGACVADPRRWIQLKLCRAPRKCCKALPKTWRPPRPCSKAQRNG